MKLTPHEILKHLGVHVPEDGIAINPHDAFMYTTLLSLLGKQMTVDAISDSDLTVLNTGLSAAHGQLDSDDTQFRSQSLERLRIHLRLVQAQDFGVAVD
ncbi:hypothetical protein PP715_23365 [Ralstonia solanacearum]|uniref:hypothetical protein n=1 Tax=Ralstonia solanacearum TaxID=305 RepID=UPI0005AC8122|nr:hypothetical protein [Ralstonia solanacearum]AMP72632.1 hypothetical protein UW163_24165 [Ralstonia solanacearum]MCL9842422.1 hypothetical protein [Ralstonia solanacearum]MDB0534518.1 hypothetical protein [Ralstonia solanacearum]MDB0539314.1 hypothetical protein [Ralstonia solanacearum]MDB0549120.1 hypothetical protein [Ralstonia solanacearum]